MRDKEREEFLNIGLAKDMALNAKHGKRQDLGKVEEKLKFEIDPSVV